MVEAEVVLLLICLKELRVKISVQNEGLVLVMLDHSAISISTFSCALFVEFFLDSHGFGFNITGRETAKGERLFYVGTVKPGGPAFGILRTGDRLLEVLTVSLEIY